MILFYRSPIVWIFIFLLIFIGIAWAFSSILAPFIFSLILAYLLAPFMNWLETFGLSRVFSGLLILTFVIGLISGFILLVLPALLGQFDTLVKSFPENLSHFLLTIQGLLPPTIADNFVTENKVWDINKFLKDSGMRAGTEVASYIFAAFNAIVIILIVPIITFYFLIDWNKILKKCVGFLPRDYLKEILNVIFEIDNLLAGFVRGQLLTCAALSFFYSVSLSVFGLTYGLLIGVFSGLISFIPFLGAVLGASIAMLVAIYQFWTVPSFIAYIGLIFLIGQFLESNFLTPKLIGSAVRLHPIIIMLSVSVGGSIGGLSGILLGVPVAGVFAVLLRRLGKQYHTSGFFMGKE